ncbi:hypothetical protein, partial [Campylobacter sp. JMF_03 NE3]|uniref:hypothetical protein n=1 Tax=Campylobacter sp. JMF_03 NE3 TaxID=2983831 RepID=UPI003FA45C97|nr:hypothetical protein [Campylobacter sp. JMF_03 NE3]
GGSVKRDVEGGVSIFSFAYENKVTVYDGKIGGYVYGGSGVYASKNSVTIKGGEITSDVIGGYAFENDAEDNSVTIEAGTIKGDVSGGRSRGTNTRAFNNKVIIKGGTIEGSVYGGSGDRHGGNEVTISGGVIKGDVYGGFGDSSFANGNTITISGGTIEGDVRAARYSSGESPNMSDTIRISGGTINGDVLNFGERTYYQGGEIKGDIRGGRNTNYLFITSGTDGLKARNVYGFSNISFNLPSSVTDGYTALNLTGTAQTNLDNTRIYAQLKDATGLTKDSKIHLIKTAGSIINFDETKTNAVLTNVNIANLVNIAGKIVLSDEKTLDLTFIGNPIPSGWSYTDQIYNIISKTEFTRNTTDGIKTFNIVSNFDNGEMTEQSNNTINMNFGDVSTNARIYGGFGDNDSTNNTINISVNSFSGNNIYGGYSTNGNATNNTINFIKGDLKVAVSLYGGFSGDSSKDMLSGNTLNIGTASTPTAMNLRARHIENFETINFYLPSSVTNDSVALNLYDSGETDLSKSTINAYLQNASNLTADSKIHLIQTAGTLNVKDEYKTADGVEQAGVKNINI